MAELSPKIEIINHFDNLIHRIDINIDQSIEKYKEDQVLGELDCFPIEKRKFNGHYSSRIEYFDLNEPSENNKCEEVIVWSESTKVIDYLNQVRQKTIGELRKAQEDSLEYLKSKSCDLKQIKESKDVEEMKSLLFADKFYFQLICINRLDDIDRYYRRRSSSSSSSSSSSYHYAENVWVFNLYTIAVDFYLSPSDIDYLEFLFDGKRNIIEEEIEYYYSIPILDEKLVLILSLAKGFYETMKTQQYPSHLITFRKQDLLSNIKDIDVCLSNFREVNFNCSSNYLSKLESLDVITIHGFSIERVNLEGFSSLKSLSLRLESLEGSSFGNLNSLKQLTLYIKIEINIDMLTKMFEICPNIEKLSLNGKFSNINFDSFVNLKKLRLNGDQLDGFNFDVFKNICNQLEELEIAFYNMNDESISKLLYGHNFRNLFSLDIRDSKITRLEKTLFDGFPMLNSLNISYNEEIKKVDNDAFSNLKNLKKLEIEASYKLSELQPELFSNLGHLEELDLALMKLTHFDLKIFHYIVNIKKINLCDRSLKNKEEILDHLKKSNIEYFF